MANYIIEACGKAMGEPCMFVTLNGEPWIVEVSQETVDFLLSQGVPHREED